MHDHRFVIILGILAAMAVSPFALAQGGGPAPPTNLQAADFPWDDGKKVILTWDAPSEAVAEYVIYRAVSQIGDVRVPPEFGIVESISGDLHRYVAEVSQQIALGEVREQFGDRIDMAVLEQAGTHKFHLGYVFRLIAVDEDGNRSVPTDLVGTVFSKMQAFDSARLPLLIVTLIFCGAVIYWINHARSGKPIKVRKIAGLEAVDEAVGRATEMGRSVLYVPGIQDINEIQTIASMTVLARVAKTAAEYDAKVEVPTSKSLVMTTARETVQAAFLAAGRPDAYNKDLIYYVTDEQFGYVAYLQGIMVREKPAACFYMGAFFAESLILAETGNSIGAIQIAGTAMPAQLPFFVAACDYTLIGEEFFAASAYLSGSPEELGSLKGQDVGKVIVAALLILGVIFATAAGAGSDAAGTWLEFLKNTVLT